MTYIYVYVFHIPMTCYDEYTSINYTIKRLTNEILFHLSVLPLHDRIPLYPVCQTCDKIAEMASTVLTDRLHGLIIISENGCHMLIGFFHIRISKQKDKR